jgi:hypothetical protein
MARSAAEPEVLSLRESPRGRRGFTARDGRMRGAGAPRDADRSGHGYQSEVIVVSP